MSFRALKKFASVLIFLLPLIWIAPPAAQAGKKHTRTAEALYQQAKKKYYALDKSVKHPAPRDQWAKVINRFMAVYETYPTSPQAYKALFTVARLFDKLYPISHFSQDRERALHFYYKVTSEFRDGRLTDDALFYQGEIFLGQKNYDFAMSAFEHIVRVYPQGDQAAKARKRIQALNAMIRKEPFLRQASTVEAVPPAIIRHVSYVRRSQSVRVVVHTSGPVEISQNRLTHPDRIYFNFFNARLGDTLKKDIHVGDDVLTGMRVSRFAKNTIRLVLDIRRGAGLKITTSDGNGKFIIDLWKPVPRKLRSLPPKIPSPVQVVPVAARSKPKPAVKKHVPLIVIDPGHGGKDFGAKSSRGLFEKNVNLAIAKRVRKILERRYKFRVLMTREDDTFISLKHRGEIANERDADLFVSIHANAARRRSAYGIETYYLGIANGEQAQETAARENGELVHSVKDDQVQQILANLISTTKINDSALLAGHVQERLFRSMKKKYPGVKDLGVKEGPFFVLHDTSMPSILIEVGFLTNKREERRLKSPEYLDRLALAIAKGIFGFTRDKGPTI
ncbi:MAG: N-acetylmuramoyl-L-alanine amidase [Nitrospinaceae bacterium]